MSEEDTEKSAAAELPETTSPAGVVATGESRARGGLTGLLALLLAVVALAISAWRYYQDEWIDAGNRSGIDARVEEKIAALEARLSSQQVQALRAIEDSRGDLQGQLSRLESDHQSSDGQLRAMLQSQQRRLLELGGVDRDDWMLAEAEYLLRLANQRLIMTADVRSAEALLGAADGILKELDDAGLYAVRQSIAHDLAALRAVAAVDVEGLWLRIQALAARIDALTLFEPPRLTGRAAARPEAADREGGLKSGVAVALEKLSGYVLIRRREFPYQALIDPQWEGLVRQNLRMLLALSRAALLSGKQTLYDQSIGDTRRWLAQYFSFNEAGAAALERELAELARINVQRDYPDISGSVSAIKTAIHKRHSVESAP